MANTQPTTKTAPVFGAIFKFAPEGRTIETVAVASDAKPAGLVFTDWESFDCAEEATIGQETVNQGTESQCFDATSGEWKVEATESTNAQTRVFYDVTITKVTPFVHQMIQAAADVDGADGGFVPGSQPGGAYRGWLHVQQQQGTEKVQVSSIWVEGKLSNPGDVSKPSPGYKPQFRFMQLGNALDAAVMGTTTV